MDKAQKAVAIDKLLALNLKEIQAMNRALKYYLRKFRGRFKPQVLYQTMQYMEQTQKHLDTLNDIERNIIEVIMEGYAKKYLKAHPYTLVAMVPKYNMAYKYLKEEVSKTELELLIGALAMYRATPGIARKYKQECVELRAKVFGGILND